MAFIYPGFLWGLLAMIIPIIIHLFDFRKNTKIEFPDIRFLKQVKHSSKKPLKLKQLLILMSRLAFVFFLVMVFAQPIIPSESKKQLRSGIKLVFIDNSQSMSALANTKETALEKAKSIGEGILNNLPNGQEVIIVTNDNVGGFLTSESLNEASESLSSINLSDKTFSLSELGLAINRFSKRESKVSDVFIISDFQKSTTDNRNSKLDTALNYWLSPVAVESVVNCVVDSVYLVNSNISEGGNTQIEIIVSNKSSQLIENLPIKVFVGNRQVSAATIAVQGFQKERIIFSLGKIKTSESGYVQIDDHPNTFDNIFYFSIPQKKLISVVEIQGEAPSQFVKPVFGNENLFITQTSNYQNIDSRLLVEADFIVLNQVDNPSLELVNQLKTFAGNGGSVLIIPSLNLNFSAYKELSSLVVKAPHLAKQSLQAPSLNAPFFSTILEKTTKTVEMPHATPVIGWGQDRSAILLFEDGSPYLSELFTNFFFVSGPLIDSMSNFQSHALFVPVMYGLATRAERPLRQLFARMQDEFYDVNIDSIGFKDVIKLTRDEFEIIPEKRKLGNNWRLVFPKAITESGIYKIEVGNKTKGSLAINLDKKESLLQVHSTKELEKLFSEYNVNFIDTFESKTNISSPFNSGIALWKYALIICLVFLLFETLLIRFL